MKSKEDIKTSVGQRKLGQVKECLSQLHVNSLEAICQNGMGISLDSIISSPTHERLTKFLLLVTVQWTLSNY